jgi:hypothetical protein
MVQIKRGVENWKRQRSPIIFGYCFFFEKFWKLKKIRFIVWCREFHSDFSTSESFLYLFGVEVMAASILSDLPPTQPPSNLPKCVNPEAPLNGDQSTPNPQSHHHNTTTIRSNWSNSFRFPIKRLNLTVDAIN